MIETKKSVINDLLRLAGRSLAFLCVCLLTYLFLLFILTNVKVTGNPLIYRASQGLVQKGGYTYERFKEFDTKANYDILAFGSSRVNRGLNPKIFEEAGYSLYNLGTDDQTPINTEVLVRHYIKPGKCKLVIIDIFDKIFSHDPLESAADLIQNLKDDKVALKLAVASVDVRTLNLLSIRMMLKNASPAYMGDTRLYKGYRMKLNEKNDFSGGGYIYKTYKKNLREFEATINYLQSVKVPFLLVCQPMPTYVNHENQKMLLRDLQPIMERTHTQLYDFTRDSTIVSLQDFADESHLTMRGAEKYSKFIINQLVSKTIKPDKQ